MKLLRKTMKSQSARPQFLQALHKAQLTPRKLQNTIKPLIFTCTYKMSATKSRKSK